MANNPEGFNFSTLVSAIHQVNENMAAQAGRAVNVSLTLRNWLIGAYIDKYELNGSDRADYGDKLLSELAKRLTDIRVSNCNRRQLYRYLRFYRLYPQIVGTSSPQLQIPPEKLAELAQSGTEKSEPKLAIRDPYNHENLGQLNTYVSWYRKNMMTDGDNPPVGILLCTQEALSGRGDCSIQGFRPRCSS